jgi:glutamate/tyrosine decarboxylase-like PLP-dependent enzyme
MDSVYSQAHAVATDYISHVSKRNVAPSADAVVALKQFDVELSDQSTDSALVIRELEQFGCPATVATTGNRYFGFVVGGSYPVAIAASWIASAWDQNAAMRVLSPIGAKLEDVCLKWIVDLIGLPKETGGGIVTGASMANFTALAAARQTLLMRQGWDVKTQGLFGAPPINVVVSDEVHSTVLKALSLLGLGSERVIRVPTDSEGRMVSDKFPNIDSNTIVCLQAGNVNTGSFDPIEIVCKKAKKAGAWVHVDGAFGLWAAACKNKKHLTQGLNLADSWAVDCHKWLNTPYDCAIALVRDPMHLRNAMTINAPYLVMGDEREPSQYTPEFSRRARAVEVWATLKYLGKDGLDSLIERTCLFASEFSQGLRKHGFTIHNDVVLNQVLVSFGSPEKTKAVIQAVQREGTLWCGGTTWQGVTAMRISVSSWATTREDVDLCIKVIADEARKIV